MARTRSRQQARQGGQRRKLAHEIARMMWEYGIEDFRLAKEKAVKRMGLRQAELPDNKEIASELAAYSQLFAPVEVADHRQGLLSAASRLMEHLADFSPRAVGLDPGAVLTPATGLRLHLFCGHPEVVDIYLQERGIDYQLEDKRFRFGADDYEYYPTYRFEFEGVEVRATVFHADKHSRVPLSPVDGRPMRRLSRQDVQELLDN